MQKTLKCNRRKRTKKKYVFASFTHSVRFQFGCHENGTPRGIFCLLTIHEYLIFPNVFFFFLLCFSTSPSFFLLGEDKLAVFCMCSLFVANASSYDRVSGKMSHCCTELCQTSRLSVKASRRVCLLAHSQPLTPTPPKKKKERPNEPNERAHFGTHFSNLIFSFLICVRGCFVSGTASTLVSPSSAAVSLACSAYIAMAFFVLPLLLLDLMRK